MKFKFLFSKEDISGFWALLADNLANIVIIAGICKGLLKMPDSLVFGRIVPGMGISILFGLAAYSFMAYKLSIREKRDNVTALPYGISTPVMFIYLFGIMTPVYMKTGNSFLAWQTGIAAAFLGGIIEAAGGLTGPYIKKHTPRAGMLGTLAGIAIVWIAVIPLTEIFENPFPGFASLSIILLGLVAGIKMPLGIPAGLAAILVGTGAGFFNGSSRISFEGVGLNLPSLYFSDLSAGLKFIWNNPSVIAIILPVEIYNFIETMNNVESAEAAGDKYDVRKTQFLDGAGTMLAGFFGSPFPTTVYIGHPAYKRLGARSGYALGVGLALSLAAITGLVSFLYALIPTAAVAPMLVFVAVIMTAQAFLSVKPSHMPAVAMALIPHIADLVYKQVTNAASVISGYIGSKFTGGADYANFVGGLAVGLIPEDLRKALLDSGGVHLAGLGFLSHGAIITGLLWGAITSLLIDCEFRKAAFFSLAAAFLSLFGFIHSLGTGFDPYSFFFWAYAGMAGLFAICGTLNLKCSLPDLAEITLNK